MTPKCICFFLWIAAAAGAQASVHRGELLGKQPLRFERANGQYVARGANYRLSLAPDRNWLTWTGPEQHKTANIETRLVQGNPKAAMEPEDQSAAKANYFVGASDKWRTEVTGFGRVRYRGVYPGIDLLFYGEQGKLEYDFILSPGADPSTIGLQLTGHRSAKIADDGDLVIATDAGDIRWKRPEIYQDVNGTRKPIAGRFRITKDTVGFAVDRYDRSLPLVIDPVLKYATYLGNHGNDSARGIAVDAAGNFYVCGATSSTDLNVLSAYQPGFGGGTAGPLTGDGFVAKFSPAGTLLYLTYLGGGQDDGVTAIAVDAQGNAYITGGTSSSDFPVAGAYQSAFGGVGGSARRTGDAFVAKLSPTGNRLLYSTYLGGTQDDIGMAIAIDSAGNAYVAGGAASPNFPTAGAFQSRFGGAGGEPIRHATDTVPEWEPGDAFVAKFDPTGSKLLFSTYLGGSLDDVAMSIAVDAQSNVYVGGCTISSNFPTTSGAFQQAYGGAEQQNEFFHLGDGFIAKLNSSGNALMYSTYFGKSGDDCITGIAIDPAGDVYFAGSSTSQDLPTTQGAPQGFYRGYNILPFAIAMDFGDAFVGKMDPTGSKLIYLTYLGGNFNDAATAIAIDSAGNAYVTGFTDSPDFPMKGPLQSQMAGDGGMGLYLFYGDAFLSVINPSGTALLYSSYFGGNEDERTFGIAVDPNGNAYIVGNTVSTNLPTTPNAVRRTFGGIDGHIKGSMRGDAYVAVFSGFPLGPPVITKVVNAEGGSTTIGPNTWVEIDGNNLSTTTRTWADADFVNSQMPTSLDGVNVTMNGKKAFVYYISGTQVNVLTPPDLTSGPVLVQLNAGFASNVLTVQAAQYSPSFFVINGGPYIVATHANGTLIGPASLYPGATTPAAPGETVVLYMNGFGLTNVAIVNGSVTQSGTLPSFPSLQIGGQPVTFLFAGLISPGLYQFNVVVPPNVPNGDNAITATYNGQTTQAGTLFTVQQ